MGCRKQPRPKWEWGACSPRFGRLVDIMGESKSSHNRFTFLNVCSCAESKDEGRVVGSVNKRREEKVRKTEDQGLGKYKNSGGIKDPVDIHET